MRIAAVMLLLVGMCAGQATAPAASARRGIPLRRFPVSREASAGRDFEMAFAIGDDYFDGHDSRARVIRHLEVAKAVGAKYLRCAFSWNGIEPKQGKFDFSFWDMLVNEAQKAGIQVIPYVAYTPEWAAMKKENFWQQPPRDPQMFKNVMRALATHFRGRIVSWELWNEPDLTEYWQGTPEYFSEIVRAGAEGVREGDPKAVVVLGGMSHGPAQFFTDLMDKYDVARWVDVIAFHGYPESWDEERLDSVYTERVAKMRELVAASGQPLDLWLDEMGYADYRYQPAHASPWGTDIYYAYEHTRQYAADELFRSFALCVASERLSLAGWYRIDDFREDDPRMPADRTHYHLGLMDVNGNPKPEFYAMQLASRLLEKPLHVVEEPVRSSAARSQAVVRVFQRADGKVIVTGWLRSSKYNEVPVHTGYAKDRRNEKVDISLPCVAAKVERFEVESGKSAAGAAQGGVLGGVPLDGQHTYVAEVTCR